MDRLIFACAFIPFAVCIGEMIHHYGRKVVVHAFGEDSPVGSALAILLRIGFYLVAAGLLLWNLGVAEGSQSGNDSDQYRSALLRLGVAIFVLGFLHGFNILALSLFHRKNPPNHVPDPASPSVTPPAGAGGAPSVAADH